MQLLYIVACGGRYGIKARITFTYFGLGGHSLSYEIADYLPIQNSIAILTNKMIIPHHRIAGGFVNEFFL